jgi:hypothetical protein
VIAASRVGSSPNRAMHGRNWVILCLMGQMRHKPTGATCAQARRQRWAERTPNPTGAFAALGQIGLGAVAACRAIANGKPDQPPRVAARQQAKHVKATNRRPRGSRVRPGTATSSHSQELQAPAGGRRARA